MRPEGTNSCRNEILGGSWNKLNSLDPSWTERVRFGGNCCTLIMEKVLYINELHRLYPKKHDMHLRCGNLIDPESKHSSKQMRESE